MVRLHHPKPRQAGLALIALTCLTILLTSCGGGKSNKLFDPAKVGFTATYNPIYDNQFYPSLILASESAQTFNDPVAQKLTPFSFTVTAPADGCVLRVVIDSSVLNYVTIIQEVLPHRGEQYTIQGTAKWKYDNLRSTRLGYPVDLTFTCYINDEEVDIENIRLNCRSINECPLSLANGSQRVDTRWLFAAYVNEDHPQIENILSDILDQGIVSSFNGYQNGPESVRRQVLAVWHYVLRRGIAYSSISCTSNPSTTTNVQHIRLFDEVWNTRQANCIDACVFFASILRKIGIRTVIFVEPCHAYLGYYTDRNRRHLELIETTITSWVNIPELQRSLDADGRLPQEQFDKISKYLSQKDIQLWNEGRLSFDQLTQALAKSLLDKAKVYNDDTYKANRTNFADTANIAYQQLDIEQLRTKVQPIR